MIKRLIALLLCAAWIGITFYRPAGLFQSIGGLFTYSTGVFSLRAPDAEGGKIELQSATGHQVSIHIDSIGIPHIYGKDAKAVAFGMGFMHARDRYFQMEVITRAVQGRLGETVGSKVTESDIFWRELDAEAKAIEVLEELKKTEPAVYAQVIAYHDGVNFYLQGEKSDHHSPEYRMLGQKPREWKPHYSLLLQWYMSYMLTYTDRDAEREQIVQNMSPELIDALYTNDTRDYPYIYPDTTFGTLDSADVKEPVAGELDVKQQTQAERELKQSIGSNNWAVSAKKSAVGRAMLCNDTHLDISLPNPWYEAHAVCPEFNVYGFSIPCSPFIISGYNESIAWGITNGDWDLVDRFLLKINPKNENEYWYEGVWKKMEEKEYTITLHNEADTIVKTHHTVFGPVVRGEKQVYARKWYPAAKNSSVVAFHYLGRAKGWDDFIKALSHFSSPPQNFAYADKQGNVGMISAGSVPIRNTHSAGGLLDGTVAHKEQFLPFASLPQHFNPDENYVYSANQKPARTGYYINYDWHAPYRAQRIKNMLDEDRMMAIKDMHAIQGDRMDIGASEIYKLVKKYRNSSPDWKIFEPLENWNGMISASSREAVLNLAFSHFLKKNFQTILKDELGVVELVPTHKLISYLHANDTISIGKKNIPTTEFFATVLRSAKEQLEKDFGKDLSKATYAPWANFRISHLARIPGFGSIVTDAGGNVNSPNVNTGGVHGASMRTVIVMGDKPEAQTVLAGGQSGRPNSPNFRNQLETWKKVEYHAAQFASSPAELKNITTVIDIK